MMRILPNSIGYTWGSTAEERSAAYPCDRYLAEPNDTLFRALIIGASRPEVFLWICQLRIAPYSYDWIDNGGRCSPVELFPGLQKLEVKQRFMDIFELVDFESNEHVTMKIDDAGARRLFGEIVLSYVVKSTSPRDTRLLVKLLARRTTDRRFSWLGPLLPWGDLIMMRKQLLTLKELCERPQ